MDEQEISAVVLEPEQLARVECTPATISVDLSKVEAAVDRVLSIYDGAEYDLDDDDAVKQAAKDRASVNRLGKWLDDRRKAVKAEVERPYKDFEARLKPLLNKVQQVSASIDSQVKTAETKRRAARYDLLSQEYEDYAGPLANVLAIDSIVEGQWLNKTTSADTAVRQMRAKVSVIVKDWEALKAMSESLGAYYTVAERQYFYTLRLGDALAAANAARDEDARIAELRAQVEPETDTVERSVTIRGDAKRVAYYLMHASSYGVGVIEK